MLSVSVAMATYNGQQHIQEQLESLATQTQLPSELVITDDRSSDDTLAATAEFAKNAPFPVRTYRNDTRLGFRGNFMRAASLCSSDLIAFCDQDDVWYDQKIEACVARFSDPEVLLVYHNADVLTTDGKILGSLRQFAAPNSLVAPMSFNPMAPVPGFTQIFRRWMTEHSHLWTLSQDHRFENERMAHDQWFYFLAAILGKIGYLDEPMAAYMQHGQNTYGYNGRANYLYKIKRGLQVSASQLSRRVEATASRATILDDIGTKLHEPARQRAKIAANHYRRLSTLNATRKEIYVSSSFGERIAAFSELLTTGSYGGTWNLSRKSFIQDLLVGVPIGSSLAR